MADVELHIINNTDDVWNVVVFQRPPRAPNPIAERVAFLPTQGEASITAAAGAYLSAAGGTLNLKEGKPVPGSSWTDPVEIPAGSERVSAAVVRGHDGEVAIIFRPL